MSEYIINDDWIREYERNIEELIGSDLEYDSATNPTPPLRKVDGTRWHELFGTPERAAQTIADVISRCDANQYAYCDDCHLFDVCEDGCNALEWLRGDA